MDGIRYDTLDSVPYYQELKNESIFFPNLITSSPYTVASLASTFSGMNGRMNGVNGYYKLTNFDKDNIFTLTQYLKDNGYYTEADVVDENIIPTYGFDNIKQYDEYTTNFTRRHQEILNRIKYKQPFFLFLRYGKVHKQVLTHFIKKYSDFDKKFFDNKKENFIDMQKRKVQ